MDRLWANLGEMGRLWANLGEMGRLWVNLGEMGRLWANYAIFDISKLSTDRFRANLGKMDGFGGL